MEKIKLQPWQVVPLMNAFEHMYFCGGIACVRGSTRVLTEAGPVEIKSLKAGTQVWSMGDDGPVLVRCEQPFVKGRERLYRVVHSAGEFVAHGEHLIALSSGKYELVQNLSVGAGLAAFYGSPKETTGVSSREASLSNAPNYEKTSADCPIDYSALNRHDDLQPLAESAVFQGPIPSQTCAPENTRFYDPKDGSSFAAADTHHALYESHPPKTGSSLPVEGLLASAEGLGSEHNAAPSLLECPLTEQFQKLSDCRPLEDGSWNNRTFSCERLYTGGYATVKRIERLDQPEEYWDVHIPGTENYLAEGVIHHNTGKTFTGSQFSLKNIEELPGRTGLIGANTYDQLSQATLREFFYWLDHYKYDYIIDQRPPLSWDPVRRFKTYKNITTVLAKGSKIPCYVFTRVMSDPDALRGVEFSWYWLDETRDTPENTHDVVLSRMREDLNNRRGLITSTANGEDWAYNRFVKNLRKGQRLYGSMHIPTIKSVEAGIISRQFYDTLLQTYSPLMAQQELNAQHVNVKGGRAYYASSEKNRMRVAPWGQDRPDPSRPLIVGCDFNYAPAPCVWVIGQMGPSIYGPNGKLWSESIHWFGEISRSEVSTPYMTRVLINQYPKFYYRIFGDKSGIRGTTSNAGVHDYAQMAREMDNAHAQYQIDSDMWSGEEKMNPFVKDRVENMNRCFSDAMGNVRQTYDPVQCPMLDADMKMVGWKMSHQLGRAKLDDGGNKMLTHASDGAGYAVWKLLPYVKSGHIGLRVESASIGSVHDRF